MIVTRQPACLTCMVHTLDADVRESKKKPQSQTGKLYGKSEKTLCGMGRASLFMDCKVYENINNNEATCSAKCMQWPQPAVFIVMIHEKQTRQKNEMKRCCSSCVSLFRLMAYDVMISRKTPSYSFLECSVRIYPRPSNIAIGNVTYT